MRPSTRAQMFVCVCAYVFLSIFMCSYTHTLTRVSIKRVSLDVKSQVRFGVGNKPVLWLCCLAHAGRGRGLDRLHIAKRLWTLLFRFQKHTYIHFSIPKKKRHWFPLQKYIGTSKDLLEREEGRNERGIREREGARDRGRREVEERPQKKRGT